MKNMNHELKVLPFLFFRQSENYNAFHRALTEQSRKAESGRGLPNYYTKIMARLYKSKSMSCVHFLHWHQMSDEEGRTIRNILNNPKGRSNSTDLLQFLSVCLQDLDEEYATYVANWCHRQETCHDEVDEDL